MFPIFIFNYTTLITQHKGDQANLQGYMNWSYQLFQPHNPNLSLPRHPLPQICSLTVGFAVVLKQFYCYNNLHVKEENI